MEDPAKNSEKAALASAMGENTHTRKTVKLKPIGQAAANVNNRPVQQVIASPLHSRDTDTGNLSVMSDTQTRKTVKLKPLASAPHRPVQVPAPAPAAEPLNVQPPAQPAKADDDITRKVATIKPAMKPNIPLPPSNVPAASKQTMVLPGKSENSSAMSSPKAPTVKLESNSVPATSKQTMVLPDDDENSATVKIARPPSRMGMIPPKPAAPTVAAPKPAAPAAPTVAAPAAKPETAPAEGSAKPLSLKKKEDTAAKPEAQAEEAAPKKLNLKKKNDAAEVGAGGPPILHGIEEGMAAGSSGSPSVFYTVITAVALILILASAAISAVNYMNLYEGKNINLPGLSSTK